MLHLLTTKNTTGPTMRHRRRGVTTVEFALVLPILFTFFIGMIEFTRLSNLRHAADNAAYEAARCVVVPGATTAEAVAWGNDLLARAGFYECYNRRYACDHSRIDL